MFPSNDRVLLAEGIGNIRLRMFDGVVKTIECWHVLELKRNLISPGTLDPHKFRYHVEQGLYGNHEEQFGFRIVFSLGQYNFRGSYSSI